MPRDLFDRLTDHDDAPRCRYDMATGRAEFVAAPLLSHESRAATVGELFSTPARALITDTTCGRWPASWRRSWRNQALRVPRPLDAEPDDGRRLTMKLQKQKVYGPGMWILAAMVTAIAWAGAAVAQTEGRPVAVEADITFTEGPTVDEAGAVYFTDLRGAGRILKMDTDGTVSTYREPSNRANGLIFDSEWRLLACEGGRGDDVLPRITRTNIETGEIEVLADSFEGRQLHQPNDLTIDGQGRIYFTDRPGPNVTPEQTGVHGVYRIDPDGSIARILTEPDIERPNGIVISPDDSTLYLIETAQQEGGARMIRAYDLAEDGTASNMRVFHDFYPGRSGDGMTIDSEGNLYVAAGLNRRRGTSETLDTVTGVHVFSPDGELLEHIPIWEDTITNVAFGGDDLRTLYITAGKTLFSIRTDVAGTRR